MSTPDLDACGACAGASPQTPATVDNRSGLATIARRVGTQPQFKTTMLSMLSELPELRTRDDSDFTIALVDAWAGLADVLTFYQERIANEAYLRTATERRSLSWLAELVGYQPQPGVAANTWLAFTMTAAPGTPDATPAPVDILAGTRVQSVPDAGELPLTFETLATVPAQVQWNAFQPSQTKPQPVTADMPSILFSGVGTGLKPGDGLVIVPDDAGTRPVLRTVASVTPLPAQQQTLVALRPLVTATPPPPPKPPVLTPLLRGIDRAIATLALQNIRTVPLDIAVSHIAPTDWTLLSQRATIHAAPFIARADDLKAFSWRWRLRPRDLFASLAAWAPPPAPAVYALRTRASLFGSNAPDPRSLSNPVATGYTGEISNGDWIPPSDRQQPVLDSTYPRIAAAQADSPSFAAMTWSDTGGVHWLVASVDSTAETGMASCTLTGKATKLGLSVVGESDSSALAISFADFATYRGASVMAESEPLTLARLSRSDEPLPADSVIDLEGWVDGLYAGQDLALTGELDQSRGTIASEVVQIQAVDQVIAAGGYTSLTLASALTNAYVRSTVTICGNVAAATHGSSVAQEALGSGDSTQASQQFKLRQAPLTWVSAATASGVASSLALRVNGVLWSERPNFFGAAPGDRIYTTRLNDEGTTRVTFGDGTHGARPPSGSENIVASYRKGIGAAGNIDAGRLSLLQVRPLGVRGVNNPVPASGGADADGPEDIRGNAALSLRALDRIVSLQDYEDFARAFGGIAKSLATWSWHGQQRGVFLTVAGIEGQDVPPDSAVYQHLLGAIADAAEPNVSVRVASYRRASFTFSASLWVDPAWDMNAVLAAVDAAARAAYAFDARAFGQPVPRSEVIALLQGVPGVVAVQVSALRRTDAALFDGSPPFVALRPLALLLEGSQLDAALPTLGPDDSLLAAELLTLDPRPLDLSAVWAPAITSQFSS